MLLSAELQAAGSSVLAARGGDHSMNFRCMRTRAATRKRAGRRWWTPWSASTQCGRRNSSSTIESSTYSHSRKSHLVVSMNIKVFPLFMSCCEVYSHQRKSHLVVSMHIKVFPLLISCGEVNFLSLEKITFSGEYEFRILVFVTFSATATKILTSQL